jgi:hypothetical protein
MWLGGAEALAKALEKNTALQSLDLRGDCAKALWFFFELLICELFVARIVDFVLFCFV